MEENLARRFGDQRVPRYTSYPTSPHFTPAVDEATYRGWLGALAPTQSLSLYLHVPFCRALCWYCGCHTKVVGHDEPIVAYTEALLREIDMVAAALPARLPVTHLHWGGGTPTIVGPKRFVEVMARLAERFATAPGAELAVEIDPRRLTAPLAAALAEAGINRVSFGVQSFDAEVQAAVNRVQTFATTAAAAEAVRKVGITRLNVDLLYGLPHQTVASCRDTVAKTLELAPDRLAVFGYAHLPSLKKHQQLIDEAALPDLDERLRQYQAISDALFAAGYVRIGLDHFARSDDELARALAEGRLHRNFQGYTTDAASALLGFGASAIGALPQGYVQNTVPIAQWRKTVMEGRLPVARGIALSADDRLRRDVIERLMCEMRVDLDEVAARHGAAEDAFAGELDALRPLAAQGVVRLDERCVEVPEEARPLLRSVAAAFDAYLVRAPGQHHSRSI
jgi:oxygen-independent coproporphyrinogen-3 oxidase